MSVQELDRVTVIRQVVEKRIKQGDAAKRLSITTRQVRRLKQSYKQYGSSGLISKKRGQPSNNSHSNALKCQIEQLVRNHYADFGPTFAAQKLDEQHSLVINKETLRQWMIEWGLRCSKKQKSARIHQSRSRRPAFGELIQIDGSHHDWFEGRAPSCCLLVFIDDATSRLIGLRFEEQETTAGYFKMACAHIKDYGRPLAYYSDKFGVFRVNHKGCEESETQFGRAMRELDVELICANSPQAKGRVERANGTLQDRLIKEMRLRGLSSIEAANVYLSEFVEDWNQRFAVEPSSQENAHREAIPSHDQLELIFSIQSTRILSKNLELSYNNAIYQVKTKTSGYRLRHAVITVCEDAFGKITLLYKGEPLAFSKHEKNKRAPDVVNNKQIENKVEQIKKRRKPGSDHPWKRTYHKETTRQASA